MSISTIQEKLFSKGCGSVLAVGAAVLMGVSIFAQCNSAAAMQDRQNGQSAIATVDGIPVLSAPIAAQAAKMGGDDATGRATSTAMATGTALRAAAIRALVAKSGNVTDDEVKKAAESYADQQTEGIKQQLVATQKIKPTATDAEIDKVVKAQTGKTLAQLKTEAMVTFTDAYKDSTRKEAVIEILGDQILTSRYGAKAVGDDTALRDSYKNYNVKRIFFSDTSGAKETSQVRADKALADLKAGKSFDSLMDTVSNDPANPGKPIHESTQSLSTEALDRQPGLISLKGKPVLSTTGIVDVLGGKAIYQLASVQDTAPADFETNKAKYRAMRAQEAGRVELERQMTALLASDAVKWENQGYRALAAVSTIASQPLGANEAAVTKALSLADAANKSANADEKQKGALAMLAISTIADNLTTMEPAKVKAIQLKALEAAVAAGLQDATINLKLAGLYADAKNGAKASDALLAASKGNFRFDAPGEAIFREIVDKSLQYEKSGLITKDQLTAIQTQQAVWSEGRTASQKADEEAKAEIAKQKKENEAEIAKQKASSGKASADDAATKKANEAEIAKQKAEAAGGAKPPVTPAAEPHATTPHPATPPAASHPSAPSAGPKGIK